MIVLRKSLNLDKNRVDNTQLMMFEKDFIIVVSTRVFREKVFCLVHTKNSILLEIVKIMNPKIPSIIL